jgi:Domain of unknown function (DUF4386)
MRTEVHVEPRAATPDIDSRVPRWLGAMFLLVIVTSFASGVLIASAAGTGSMSDVLVGVAGSPAQVRLGMLLGLVTSLAIVGLAVLLYVVLRGQAQVLALVALGWWLAEAIVLAVAKAGDAALIGLGQAFVAAGSPADAHYQALASFLYTGLDKGLGSTTHMLFYCAGGLIWYGLFLRSGYLPRAIPAFGLLAVALGLAGSVAEILGAQVSILVYLPLLPFELVIGTWLLARGIRVEGGQEDRQRTLRFLRVGGSRD